MSGVPVNNSLLVEIQSLKNKIVLIKKETFELNKIKKKKELIQSKFDSNDFKIYGKDIFETLRNNVSKKYENIEELKKTKNLNEMFSGLIESYDEFYTVDGFQSNIYVCHKKESNNNLIIFEKSDYYINLFDYCFDFDNLTETKLFCLLLNLLKNKQNNFFE